MAGFLSYETINECTKAVIEEANAPITAVLIGAKTLAVGFLLINWLKEFIQNKTEPSEGKLPVGIKSIIFGICYILLIASWNNVVGYVDKGLDAFVQTFELDEKTHTKSIFAEMEKRFETQRIAEEAEDLGLFETVAGKVQYYISKTVDSINGAFISIIVYLIKAIAWVVNIVAYPIFQLERAFLLFIMNIIAPMVLALGALDKFRDMVYKWFKIYIGIFLTGLLFLCVTWFCESIFLRLYENFSDITFTGQTVQGGIVNDLNFWDRHLVEVCILTVIAFTKVKLYNSSISLTNRIFS